MKTKRLVCVAAILAVAAGGMFCLFNRSEIQSADALTAKKEFSESVQTQAVFAAATGAESGALSSRGTKSVDISCPRTMTASVRRELEAMGVRIIGAQGARSVSAEATPAVCRRVAATGKFTVSDVTPEEKIQESLAALCAQKGGESLPVYVEGLAAADREDLRAWVIAKGGELMEGPTVPSSFRAKVPAALVADLAARGDVRWIEHAAPLHLLNDLTAKAGASDVETIRSVHMLTGRGQTVAVYDSGFDTGNKDNCHLDFAGRVVDIVNEGKGGGRGDYMGHGTHVAGTVLGNGARSDGQYKGMAPRALLYAQAGGDFDGSNAIYTPSGDQAYEKIFAHGLSAANAFIHSDSWGSDVAGEYTETCQGLDRVAWEHPELLVVVASGNAGGKASEDGDGSVGSPASAKNALTVGNTHSTRKSIYGLEDTPENLNFSSSQGPTKDKRIKPDIAAPGTAVYSTLSSQSQSCKPIAGNPYYTEMTGTSMATPLVSGAAALTREWLAERRHCPNPSAALVKAILTGGGQLMTGKWGKYLGGYDAEGNLLVAGYPLPDTVPNNYEGWGRLNLEQTLYPTNRAVKLVDRIPFADGETQTIDLTTTADADLDVQLVWTDYPADLKAAREQALVNDLDLIVSNKVTDAVWYGNGGEEPDRKNTVESVRIPAAEAGDYAILIVGAAVPHGSDEGGAAAVYIRGAFEDETEPDPEYVRIAGKKNYETLNDALKDAVDGDRIEILAPCLFERSVTVGVSCTIVATNDDAAASLVTRVGDATLTVAPGATLTVENLALSLSSNTLVKVEAGGCLSVGGQVDFGVDPAFAAVETADAAGFLLTGPLDCELVLSCAAAKGAGETFGAYDCADDVAAASGLLMVEVDDEFRALYGSAEDGALVWRYEQCPLGEAAGSFDVDGETFAYARLDWLFQSYTNAVARGSEIAEIVIRSPEEDDALSCPVTVTGELTIRGISDDSVIVPTETASFTIENGGSLTLSQVTFANGYGPGLFFVWGGEMTLEAGACLYGLTTAAKRHPGEDYTVAGGVTVYAGKLTMMPDSSIEYCNTEIGYGGAVSLWGQAYPEYGDVATLDLKGGTITGCSAGQLSGGVYAYYESVVNVEGPVQVYNNVYADHYTFIDDYDLWFADSTCVFTLTGALTDDADVRVYYEAPDEEFGNEIGQPFVTVGDGLDESVVADSAKCFYNDVHLATYRAVPSDDGKTLVWQDMGDRCDPEYAKALLCYPGSELTNYYLRVKTALLAATNNAVVVMLDDDVLLDVDQDSETKIDLPDGAITLKSADDAPSPFVLTRIPRYHWETDGFSFWTVPDYENFYLSVGAETSLRLENVVLDGDSGWDDPVNVGTLIRVDGGALTLGTNSVVQNVLCTRLKGEAAIEVYEGGSVSLESSATVVDCVNRGPEDLDHVGSGALNVVAGFAHLNGGTVSDSPSPMGGAVYLNEAPASFSGDLTIDALFVRESMGRDTVVLTGPFTGHVVFTESNPYGLARNTGAFGVVDEAYADESSLDDLAVDAAHFVNSADDGTGCVATNGIAGAKTILVWSTALKTDEQGKPYFEMTDENGLVQRYDAVSGDVPPPPQEWTVKTNYPSAIAFQSISNVNATTWALVITNREPYCNYRLLATDDLTKGFTETGAWEKASADVDPIWRTNVTTTGGAWFWRAEGTEGTNMVPPVVEN